MRIHVKLFSFLVGFDGTVFEGRGWGVVGAHAKGSNHDSLGIAFMGNFNSTFPHSLFSFMHLLSPFCHRANVNFCFQTTPQARRQWRQSGSCCTPESLKASYAQILHWWDIETWVPQNVQEPIFMLSYQNWNCVHREKGSEPIDC